MRLIPALSPLLTVPALAIAAVGGAHEPSPMSVRARAPLPAGAPTLLPELPRPFALPSRHPVRRTIAIAAGDTAALRRALATAQSGDEIVLAFGTYVGWWELGAHTGTGWVTIRSADTTGVRRARLVTPGKNQPALRVPPGVHRWRVVGLEFGAMAGVRDLNTLVFLGAADGQTKVTDDHPSDLVFDRVRMTAHDSLDLRRCLLGNADRWALLRSDLVCHGRSADAAAISAWAGARGVLIEGNRIAGSGHGIIFGGADAADSTLLPRDIVLRGNRIYKPMAWKGVYQAKTLVEFKVGRRVLLEGNLLEHHSAWRADRNALIGAFPNSRFPPSTRGAASLADVGFLDPSGADPSGFALRLTSAYRGLGAPIDTVLAATAGARALR